MTCGISKLRDYYSIMNLSEDSGEHASVDETTSKIIFVAPHICVVKDIMIAVTTTVAAHATNTWSIQVTNQTGDVNLLSSAFNTDSDSTGNGGRALTEDTLTSISDAGAGTVYLQNAMLAKGDMLKLTATMANTPTALAYPQVVVRYSV